MAEFLEFGIDSWRGNELFAEYLRIYYPSNPLTLLRVVYSMSHVLLQSVKSSQSFPDVAGYSFLVYVLGRF